MRKLLTVLLIALSFSCVSKANAQIAPTLTFNPSQTVFQFDVNGNLSFQLVPANVVTTASTCKLKMLLASSSAPLNKGRIKNAAAAPAGALFLFTAVTPAGLPNSTLTATTTGLTSKPKKGKVFGRAALQCGTAKKKTFVFSPLVSFDFSLMTNASKKSGPQVAKEWKGKTVTSF